MAPPSQSELRNPTTNHKVPTMSHTHTQFDLVRHTLNVVATHTHSHVVPHRKVWPQKPESHQKLTPYKFSPGLLLGPGVATTRRCQPILRTRTSLWCFFLSSDYHLLSLCLQSLKKDFGSLARVRAVCLLTGRCATSDWGPVAQGRRGGGGTPVIKAAPLLAATALGKSLKWQSGKSKWHERACEEILQTLSFCKRLKANEHIIYKWALPIGQDIQVKSANGKRHTRHRLAFERSKGRGNTAVHWKTSEQSIWREIHTTHHNNPYNQF